MTHSPLAYLVVGVIIGTPVAWLVVDMIRLTFAKGTHARYCLATAEHALRYPAGTFTILLTAATLTSDDTTLFQGFLRAAFTLYMAWRIFMAHHDDDDDWFKGKGKKLRTFVRNLNLGPRVAVSHG